MTLRRTLAAAAAGLAVLGTPTALAQQPSPASAPGQICTEIGCQSGVFLNATAYLAAHPAVQRVRVCARGRCRSLGRGDQLAGVQPLVLTIAREEAITVTVTAFGRRGRVALRRKLVADLRRAQPNGPQCQPICFQVNLVLSTAGRLRA